MRRAGASVLVRPTEAEMWALQLGRGVIALLAPEPGTWPGEQGSWKERSRRMCPRLVACRFLGGGSLREDAVIDGVRAPRRRPWPRREKRDKTGTGQEGGHGGEGSGCRKAKNRVRAQEGVRHPGEGTRVQAGKLSS